MPDLEMRETWGTRPIQTNTLSFRAQFRVTGVSGFPYRRIIELTRSPSTELSNPGSSSPGVGIC